ncbi:ComEC/Rec2 family competence protein [Streptosporangium lutulentum]
MTRFSASAMVRDSDVAKKGARTCPSPGAAGARLMGNRADPAGLLRLGSAVVAVVVLAGMLAVVVVIPAEGIAGWRNAVVAVLGCAAAVAGTTAFRVHAVSTGPVAELVERRSSAVMEAVVTDDPRALPQHGGVFRREGFVVPARIESIGAGADRVTLRAPVVLLASGGVASVAAQPADRAHRAVRPGRSRRAARRNGAGPGAATGSERALVDAACGRDAPIGVEEAAGVLPPDQRGLLPGLVVGDVSRMDEQVKADFKEAGLSHLTAVSGANLAIVAGAAVAIARTAGLPLAARAVLAALAMLAFAVVARPSPSVLRALLMGGVTAVALGTGRVRDGVAALSATVLGLIFFDPALARSYGFALSVCATAGILVLAPRWRDRLSRRMPRWAAEATAVAAAAQAAVTPVLVLMSGQLAPVAIPANLLAGPAVAPATLLGVVAALVAPLHMGAAQLLVRPAGLATGWIIEVAEHAAGLPLAVIPWPGGVTGLIVLAVAVPVVVRRCDIGGRAGSFWPWREERSRPWSWPRRSWPAGHPETGCW